MIRLQLSDDHRRALQDAAELLRAQTEGLRRTGSQNTAAALESYVATLEQLAAAGGEVEVSAEQRTHIEKAKHILEGFRDGLFNADFEKRAGTVDSTILSLDDIVTEFNTQTSQP